MLECIRPVQPSGGFCSHAPHVKDTRAVRMVRRLLAGRKRDERENSGGGASGGGGVRSWGNAAGVLHHVASTPPFLSSCFSIYHSLIHRLPALLSVDGNLHLRCAEEAKGVGQPSMLFRKPFWFSRSFSVLVLIPAVSKFEIS